MDQSPTATPSTPAQTITLTFPYPITHYSTSPTPQLLTQITNNVQKQCDAVSTQFGCHVSFTVPDNARYNTTREGPVEVLLSVTVIGTQANVGRARGAMLRGMPTQTMITIKSPHHLLLSPAGEMKPYVRKRLDAIMSTTRTEITCVGQNQDSKGSGPPGLADSGPEKGHGESMDVEILGRWEDVEMARMDVLVLLDELAGLHVEPLQLPPNLHPLLAGRKRCILETVMHDTQTNVYLPTPFLSETCISEQTQQVASYARTIWVTGTLQGVRAAVERLGFMAKQRSTLLQTRTIPCLPRKLDWLLLNRKDSLRKIMTDNATHITVPPLGSNQNTVSITGDDRVYLERSCRALMYMLCDFYVAGIQLSASPIPATAATTHPLLSALAQVPLQTHSEVLLSTPFIEIYGLNPFVKSAFLSLTSHPTITPLIRDTKFQLELALSHRDFINGKKNGKINKIIKSSGCRVTFQENFNDWNMFIDLYNTSPPRCVEGLGMLEDELPAEISFYVPEAFHKRIIGVGGKNIQRIMKKYAVYVKFSNAEEFAQLGGYFENMDNVIARTPAKNAVNLENLKENIMALTGLEERSKVEISVPVSRLLHRDVVGPRGVYLQDIIKATKVEIQFPEKESGKDDVTVKGPEPNVGVARARLLELVPTVTTFVIPGSQTAYFAVNSTEAQALIQRIAVELAVDLYIHHPPPESMPEGVECTFLLHFRRVHTPPGVIDQAKAMIMDYLTVKGVPLATRTPGLGRSGSYANLTPQRSYDSFQHFHSKLLAGVTTSGEVASSMAYSGFFPEGAGMAGSKFAHSSPNLRQLFEDFSPSMAPSGSSDQMKRSRSDVNDTTNILAATLAATSLNPNPSQQWTHSFPRRPGPPAIDTTPADDDGDSGLNDPSQDPELLKGFAGMLSPIDAPDRSQLGDAGGRVPNDKFCGLKLSRSMGMLDDKSAPRFGRDPNAVRMPSNLADTSAAAPPPQFTQETISALFALEAQNPKSFNQTQMLLSSLELDNYVPIFIEQEVDFPTLLLLGDADLKELGVKAFGTRKRILAAIKECKDWKERNMGGQSQYEGGGSPFLRRPDMPSGQSQSARSSTAEGPRTYTPSPIMPRASLSAGSRPQSQQSHSSHSSSSQQGTSTSPFGPHGSPSGPTKGYGHYVYSSGPDASSSFPSAFGSLPLGTRKVTPPLQSGRQPAINHLDSSSTSDDDGIITLNHSNPKFDFDTVIKTHTTPSAIASSRSDTKHIPRTVNTTHPIADSTFFSNFDVL